MALQAQGRVRCGHRARAVAGALVLAVIAGGCGGNAKPDNEANGHLTPTPKVDPGQTGTSASQPGPAASACKLLSEGDVTAAMRQPMKVSGDGGSICSYSATADPSVVLYLQTFANKAEATTDTQLEPSSDSIDGLGDDAFWNSTLDLVFVQVGDRAFSVTSPSLATLVGDPQASSTAMVGLAKIVLRTF
jgi:hypothetical protein